MGSKEQIEPESTPAEAIVSDVRQAEAESKRLRKEAFKCFLGGSIFAGLSVAFAVSGEAPGAGIEASAAAFFFGDGSKTLQEANEHSQRAASLRQALAQHGLATGQVIPVYETEEQAQASKQDEPTEA